MNRYGGNILSEMIEQEVREMDSAVAEAAVEPDRAALKQQIEAILFAMGESVEADRMAVAIGVSEEEIHAAAAELMEDYENGHGIQITKLENAYQFATKAEQYETLVKIAKTPKKHVLTTALLETLSIVAYRQPVTRADIEAIRGVKCDHAISRLMEYGLIMEAGRLQAPGRPIVFGTTEEFLRSFGIQAIGDLPQMDQDQREFFRREAEKEAGVEPATDVDANQELMDEYDDSDIRLDSDMDASEEPVEVEV